MMMILDKPYVSQLLSQTLINLNIPAVKSGEIRIPLDKSITFLTEQEVIEQLRDPNVAILCNSEYSVASIYPYLKETSIIKLIDLFKNKVRFRQQLQKLFPSFFFRECTYEEIFSLPVESLTFPLVIKPARGFRSVGVYLVEGPAEWKTMLAQLQQDMRAAKEIYPEAVVSANSFILEEWIQGEEYAIDAYYNEAGEPVVLNVFKRMFAHEADTSDRIYYTGKSVLTEALDKVEVFMRSMGEELPLKNFPMHFEVRISKNGQLIPIEVNPLRFAGLCTTDLGAHACGVNVYEYFFEQKKPDWPAIIKSMDDSIFSFLCAELPLSIEGKSIESVHDRKFEKNFSNLLDYRLIPYEEYPTFSVVFYQSPSLKENEHLLQLDLEQYLVMK
ncbi:UNVERIFIED_CONTAM: hypothetical protein ABID98_005408 [Brevibacillus sp. OAP136]